MPQPILSWQASPADAKAVALVMHGGAAQGRELNYAWSHNVARLVPFAWSLAWSVPGPLAVARLRFGVRGWNGAERSPVSDACWALEQIRERYPDRPIAVVGHSMGGRAALHIADEQDVDLLVGLATWVDPGDPLPANGVRSVFIHSDRDRITSIAGPRRAVETLRGEGKDASLIRVAESDHAMLRRAGTWTALVSETVKAHFADELGVPWHPRPGPVGEVVSSVMRDGEAFVDI
jgi:pimeloyl-ACP methyl ester carboxylesterase